MAEGDPLRDVLPILIGCTTLTRADRLVTQLRVEHPGAVVLLKGSHASGLSALAERWQALAAQ